MPNGQPWTPVNGTVSFVLRVVQGCPGLSSRPGRSRCAATRPSSLPLSAATARHKPGVLNGRAYLEYIRDHQHLTCGLPLTIMQRDSTGADIPFIHPRFSARAVVTNKCRSGKRVCKTNHARKLDKKTLIACKRDRQREEQIRECAGRR